MTRDPDWWRPATDDYAATYDETTPAEPCRCHQPECVVCGGAGGLGEEYADEDARIRYSIERGRPGFTHPDED